MQTAYKFRWRTVASIWPLRVRPIDWGLRDYGLPGTPWTAVTYTPMAGLAPVTVVSWRGCLGLEPTPEMFVAHIVAIFREVHRVLRDDGTVFLNLGDSYNAAGRKGHGTRIGYKQGTNRASSEGADENRPSASGLKEKDLCGIPWRVAFALQADGWYLRSAITWCKGSPMPESVTDRPAKATEQVFLLAKSQRYFFDNEALRGVAKSLNQLNRSDEVPLELIVNRATSARLAAQCGEISLVDQWAPYLILAALLGSERVLVEERHDDLCKILDTFKSPADRITSIAVLASLLWAQSPTKLIPNILKHLLVVLSEGDLDGEAELWVRLRSFSCAMEGHNASFAVEEASEIMAKIITDAQAIRDVFPLDLVGKCFVDVDAIHKAVPLLQASDPCAGHARNGLVTKALLEQLDLALRSIHLQQHSAVVSHENLRDMGSLVPPQYTTKTPAGKRNAWDWWVINPRPYKGAHFATFPPELVAPCVLAGTSQRGVCPECGAPWERVVEKTTSFESNAGKAATRSGQWELRHTEHPRTDVGRNEHDVRYGPCVSSLTTGWRPTCNCGAPEGTAPDDWEIIASPTGERGGDDPTIKTGRGGYNRPRGENEGQRHITQYEQRRYADQLRTAEDSAVTAKEAGKAFAHYLRKDRTGARPIPAALLEDWIERGLLDRVLVPEWEPPDPVPATVLDPFCGSGTVGEVCFETGRRFVGLDLSMHYLSDFALPRAERKQTTASVTEMPLFDLEWDDDDDIGS